MSKKSSKEALSEVNEAMRNVFSRQSPSLGIDIDGCVDEAPVFFQILTRVWPGKVFVVSFRNDRAKAEADLKERDIRFDELILVDSLEAKAKVIAREGILVFFDDQPECLKHMDSMRNVMLVRNAGNFDFEDKRWVFSEVTGKLV
jgi:hypothetical protein